MRGRGILAALACVAAALEIGAVSMRAPVPQARPARPPHRRAQMDPSREWMHELLMRVTMAPSLVGEEAPDFVLPDARTGEPVRLREAAAVDDRPTVLIFGSWG